MNLKKWPVLLAVLIGGEAQAHGPDREALNPRLIQQLDAICGTFGASYVDTTHWTLFRKRGPALSNSVSLCLDDDCGVATLKDGYFQRDIAGELNSTHRLIVRRAGFRDAKPLESMSLSLTAKTCPIGNPAFAPDSSAGLDVVLSIEHTTSSLPGGYPTMGAVVQSYATDGTYSYRGAGGPNQLKGPGTYTYVKTGRSTALEDAMQSSDYFTLPYHMEYTFDRPDAGHWVQNFAGGLIVFEGTFATSPSSSSQQWAPDSLAGTRITLLTDPGTRQPCAELMRSRYDGQTYLTRTIATQEISQGTYVVHKLSARSLVEEDSDADGLKYVRVYTFTHAHGGEWKQAQVASGERTQGLFRYND